MTVKLIDHYDCDIRGYLVLDSFAGKDNARCVQLTMGGGEGYVQLTFDDARAFFQEAIKKINEIEAEFNDCSPWWETILY